MTQKLFSKLCLIALLSGQATMTIEISHKETSISATEKLIDISVSLPESQTILKPTFSISLDCPEIEIGTISYSIKPIRKYFPELLETKEVFEGNLIASIPLLVTQDNASACANMHISFLILPDGTMSEKIIPISFNTIADKEASTTTLDDLSTNHQETPIIEVEKKSFTQSLQELVQTTESNWIRFLFAFLLGLLLSLTPCIYPMIPITIGILNHNRQQSVLSNFLVSMFYAFGLSTTFASLGLLAAFAGASFGGMLSNPIFVIILTLFIGYMSLTMIGIIDLTIPSFLQRNTQMSSAFGPWTSAFIFGLISGSIASPCVSPGLALLLTIVATMGNIIAGFLLLFLFGIGMSVPLIIIGTFSSSMQVLPRAGQWMVEIKKLLGFLMLATCFHYLSNILPAIVISIMFTTYLLITGLYYIIDAQKNIEQITKMLKSLLGIALLAAAVFMTLKAYESMTTKNKNLDEQGVIWATNYQNACTQAKAENKLVLLDFWANHCTICKAIEKKLFHKDVVAKGLFNNIICVKVDCTSSSNQEANMLKGKFNVFAQPAILIINPTSESVLKKWSSEPYSMTPEAFVLAVNAVK